MSTPSIKRALRGDFNDEKQVSAKEQHELYSKADEMEPFDEAALKEKWTAFLSTLSDRPNLKATLSNVPKLEADCTLLLEIDNGIQDDLITSIRPQLVSYLRRELRNSKINLKTKITEVKHEKRIYLDGDRYEEMVKKNPDLAYFKKKLNLDF